MAVARRLLALVGGCLLCLAVDISALDANGLRSLKAAPGLLQAAHALLERAWAVGSWGVESHALALEELRRGCGKLRRDVARCARLTAAPGTLTPASAWRGRSVLSDKSACAPRPEAMKTVANRLAKPLPPRGRCVHS